MNRFNLIHQPNASPLSLGTDIHEYFNGKTGRTGHLFDNRYSRVAVESDTQAVQLLDYIHLYTHWGQTYMCAFTHLGQTSICHFVVLGMFLSFIVYK